MRDSRKTFEPEEQMDSTDPQDQEMKGNVLGGAIDDSFKPDEEDKQKPEVQDENRRVEEERGPEANP